MTLYIFKVFMYMYLYLQVLCIYYYTVQSNIIQPRDGARLLISVTDAQTTPGPIMVQPSAINTGLCRKVCMCFCYETAFSANDQTIFHLFSSFTIICIHIGSFIQETAIISFGLVYFCFCHYSGRNSAECTNVQYNML